MTKLFFTPALLVFLLIITICSCKRINPNAVIVEITEPVNSVSTLLFTTIGGRAIILADAVAAQNLNNMMLKEKENMSLFQLGVGNAFAVDSAGKFFLYTARHCAVGIEKLTRTVNLDVAIINYEGLKSATPQIMKLTEGYQIDTNVIDNDSVFVRGYLSDKKGKVYSVTVSGIGKRSNIHDFDGVEIEGEKQYFQAHSLNMLLNENVDLAGLSGAPAFNKAGKVIGIYSGRTYDSRGIWQIRISLFN